MSAGAGRPPPEKERQETHANESLPKVVTILSRSKFSRSRKSKQDRAAQRRAAQQLFAPTRLK
jgi:hypothetical protein